MTNLQQDKSGAGDSRSRTGADEHTSQYPIWSAATNPHHSLQPAVQYPGMLPYYAFGPAQYGNGDDDESDSD